MSSWIERIKNYDEKVEMLKLQCKACFDKEEDKRKLKKQIVKLEKQIIKLENDLKNLDDARKNQIIEGQAVIAEKQKMINDLKSTLSENKKTLTNDKKEIKRLSTQISLLTNEKAKLEDLVEFLKKNRRSPNMEEIKNYELKRKKLLKK